jgi:colicin import membrane protein
MNSAAATSTTFTRWRPQEPGTKRAMMWSLGAHLLLAAFLGFSLDWKNSTPTGVEAELWDSVPTQQFKEPEITPEVKQAEAPADSKADIATKKEKKKESEPKEKIVPPVEKKPEPKPVKEKEKKEEKPKETPKEISKEKSKEKAKEDKPKESSKSTAAQDKERADRLAKLRAAAGDETGGSGGTTGTGVGSGGTAKPGYTDRVNRYIRPFITFDNSSISNNPQVVFRVEVAPDGNIISKRLVKSSGNESWDNAVSQAIDRAKRLPKDEDGKIPDRQFDLKFKPKD